MKNGKVYRPLVKKDLDNLKAGDIVYHCDTHEPFVIEKVDEMFLFDKKIIHGLIRASIYKYN